MFTARRKSRADNPAWPGPGIAIESQFEESAIYHGTLAPLGRNRAMFVLVLATRALIDGRGRVRGIADAR
jgi:hypothetical protein